MPPRIRDLLPMYILVFSSAILLTLHTNRAVTAFSSIPRSGTVIILDAGHGGEDGGAISCTGADEAHINLQITQRLNDLLHLLGYDAKMLRTDNTDLHTEGKTISQRKNSDLLQRTKIINETAGGLLISIHQNHFPDGRYSGAQVFWADTDGSKKLAEDMQHMFVATLNPGSKRSAKQASGIYVMEHIKCTGVLVECGFLSNPTEEALLRSEKYQKQISAVVAVSVCRHIALQTPSA